MNNFEDLQAMAAEPAHKKQHRGFWIILLSYPLMLTALFFVLCSAMFVAYAWAGWGMWGGVAALFAMLTVPVFYQEVRYLITGE